MGVEGIEMSWEELKELGRRVGGVGRVRGAEGSRGSWPNKVNVDRWWVGGMRSLPRQFRF